VLRVENLAELRPQKHLPGYQLPDRTRQRLVIVGLNGVGKTTLLRSILALRHTILAASSSATACSRAFTPSENEGLDYDNTVLNEATAVLPEDVKRVRGVLGRFLFTGDRRFPEDRHPQRRREDAFWP